MTETITYGSLCTGYDGIGLGLALAGVRIKPLWLAEVEPAMSRVLKREHDGVPNVGDIKLAPWQLAPHVALMSSGDPCQTISIAGRQEGRKDPRFLWPWVRHAYRQVMPDVLFFENVANIVSHDKGFTLRERHDDLRTDGYEVRWCVLGACAVGAPHHRHRYYAVAVRWRGEGPPPEARRVDGGRAICGAPRSGGRFLLPTPLARDAELRNEGDRGYWERRGKPNGEGAPLGAVVNLLPTPKASDGEKGRSNPGQVYGSGTLPLSGAVALLPTPIVGDAKGGHSEPEIGGERPSGAKRMDTLGSVARLLDTTVARAEVWGKYADAVALWEHITGVPAPAPTEPGAKGAPRLSPALPEWMMGLRPGLLTGELSRPEALKGAGNGVVPLACAAAWRLLTAPLG